MSTKRARNLGLTDLGAVVIVQTGFGQLRGYLTDFRPDVTTVFAGGGVEAVYIRSVDLMLTASPWDEQTLTVSTETKIEFPEEEARDGR